MLSSRTSKTFLIEYSFSARREAVKRQVANLRILLRKPNNGTMQGMLLLYT